MKDFGYDIADFYDIQPEYGTLADFDDLIAKAKSLDIKIILDFVPNVRKRAIFHPNGNFENVIYIF